MKRKAIIGMLANGSLRTPELVGNLIASGQAEDMIVVTPAVYASTTQDECSGMDDANNAITGHSMGGGESLIIGQQRPDLFGYVGTMCPAPGVPGNFRWNSEEESPSLMMLTAGGNDTVVYNTPDGYRAAFARNGVPHIWHFVGDGTHGDDGVQAHLYNFVRFIFKA